MSFMLVIVVFNHGLDKPHSSETAKHCLLFLAMIIKMEQEDDDCNSEEFDIDNQILELEQRLLLAFDDEMEATTEDDRGDEVPLPWTTNWNTDPSYDKGEEEEVEVEVDEEELENAADDEVGVVEEDKWLMKNVDEEMTEVDLHIFARRLQIAD